MTRSNKIILPIVVLVVAAISAFFLAPLDAWKKRTGIIRIEKDGSTITEEISVTYTPDNCNYAKYCYIWWTCYFGTQKEFTDDYDTYYGGVIDEITATANANN